MICLTVVIFAWLQASPSVQPIKPIIQNSERTAVSDKPQNTEKNKESSPLAVGHPLGAEQAPRKEQTEKAEAETGVYKVEIVSQPNQPHDPWFIASVLINVLLVLAAGGTLLVLWRQTNKLGEQVKQMIKAGVQTDSLIRETGKSAEAALLNVRALVNAERAWIDVDVMKSTKGGWAITITNHGKTPGQVLNYKFSVQTLPSTKKLAKEDLNSPLLTWNVAIFLASGEHHVLDDLKLPALFDSWDEVLQGKKFGIFQMIVNYKHIVSEEEVRESHAVFWFSPITGAPEKLPAFTAYK